jgi:hypothetical protein
MITVHHSCHNLTQCIQIFRETGSVDRKKGSGLPTKRTEEAIRNVRQVMEEVPRTSVRRLSQQVQLSTSRYLSQHFEKGYPPLPLSSAGGTATS